jgi:hypothetical protein
VNTLLQEMRSEAEQAADALHDLGLHLARLDPAYAAHPALTSVRAGLRQVAEVIPRFSTVLAMLADPRLQR